MNAEEASPRSSAAKSAWRLSSTLLALALVPVAGVAAALALVFGTGDSWPDGPTALLPETSNDARSATWCPETVVGALITGAGRGDFESGPGLILRMNHAIYVERDADAARSVFAQGAAVASPAETRSALAALPAGVQHCVRISPLVGDRFAVSVEERYPSGRNQLWDTVVSIGRQSDGRLLITAVTPAGGDG
ncbi:hypothetical protein [Antrihabitans stalactiti]|jgi:hypothetical protein|uniref:DUF8176 domain-containing protein n=1 Tax=Antrihabitans stalactiti TaxID=2584121 RepID=A0A848KQX3_9NOCA|nr:hypothetical protein [Antrihabitans stalactiti]NMN99304.1 hypothetical protein [Antrihabitans stalactiti]